MTALFNKKTNIKHSSRKALYARSVDKW